MTGSLEQTKFLLAQFESNNLGGYHTYNISIWKNTFLNIEREVNNTIFNELVLESAELVESYVKNGY